MEGIPVHLWRRRLAAWNTSTTRGSTVHRHMGLLLLQPWNTIKKEESEICSTNQKMLGFVWNLSWDPFPSSAPWRPGLTLGGCSIYGRAIQYVCFVNHQL